MGCRLRSGSRRAGDRQACIHSPAVYSVLEMHIHLLGQMQDHFAGQTETTLYIRSIKRSTDDSTHQEILTRGCGSGVLARP
jgi:hypothetical protein